MTELLGQIAPLLKEVECVFARMPAEALAPLATAILAADRILLYGQGRTGLRAGRSWFRADRIEGMSRPILG